MTTAARARRPEAPPGVPPPFRVGGDDDPRRPLGADECHELVEADALRAGAPGPVGLELESHLVDLADPRRRVPWQQLTAAVGSLPALPGGSVVSVEPGGQLELSGPPATGAAAAVADLRRDHAVVARALAAAGLGLAVVGADPLRPAARVSPGARYAAMEQHFAATGQGGAGRAMMCSTASLQVNLEAGAARDWPARVALVHQLGPVLVAVSACSPWLCGAPTGWRSSRQQVWGELDQLRCGPLGHSDDPAHEWATYALSAPVMLVRAPGGPTVPVPTVVTFREWAAGVRELGDRRPTRADLEYHLTTLFPPARLRGFLEIRYLDAAPGRWWGALAALTAALVDDPVAAGLAREATEATGRAWVTAARAGLADPALARAARRVLEVGAAAVAPPLRADVEALAELVASGRSPGDQLGEDLAREGAVATLTEVTRA